MDVEHWDRRLVELRRWIVTISVSMGVLLVTVFPDLPWAGIAGPVVVVAVIRVAYINQEARRHDG